MKSLVADKTCVQMKRWFAHLLLPENQCALLLELIINLSWSSILGDQNKEMLDIEKIDSPRKKMRS